jgi:hypothetical protein
MMVSVLGLFVIPRAEAGLTVIESAARVAINHLEALRAEASPAAVKTPVLLRQPPRVENPETAAGRPAQRRAMHLFTFGTLASIASS